MTVSTQVSPFLLGKREKTVLLIHLSVPEFFYVVAWKVGPAKGQKLPLLHWASCMLNPLESFPVETHWVSRQNRVVTYQIFLFSLAEVQMDGAGTGEAHCKGQTPHRGWEIAFRSLWCHCKGVVCKYRFVDYDRCEECLHLRANISNPCMPSLWCDPCVCTHCLQEESQSEEGGGNKKTSMPKNWVGLVNWSSCWTYWRVLNDV